MQAESIDLDTLLTQFGKLGRRDRKAVLARLAPAERDRVEAVIAAQGEARQQEAERIRRAGRQFAGYSPWLAELLQQACANDGETELHLSDAARRAIVDAHRALLDDDEAEPHGFAAQLRAWGAMILSPQTVRNP